MLALRSRVPSSLLTPATTALFGLYCIVLFLGLLIPARYALKFAGARYTNVRGKTNVLLTVLAEFVCRARPSQCASRILLSQAIYVLETALYANASIPIASNDVTVITCCQWIWQYLTFQTCKERWWGWMIYRKLIYSKSLIWRFTEALQAS